MITGSGLRLGGGAGAEEVKTGSSVRTGAGETEEMEWSAAEERGFSGLSGEETKSSMRASPIQGDG
jgi:hypothetical protein